MPQTPQHQSEWTVVDGIRVKKPTPQTPGPSTPPSQLAQSFSDFGQGLWRSGPGAIVELGKSLVQPPPPGTTNYPGRPIVDMVANLLQQGEVQRQKGVEAWGQGRPVEGALRGGAFATSLLGGGMLADLVDRYLAGQVSLAGATGEATGLLAPFAARALPRTGKVPGTGVLRNKNPKEAAALDMAMREGVPVDLGTATGRTVVSKVRELGDDATLAGLIDRPARRADALTKLGTRTADRVRPGTPTTPEVAGTLVQDRLQGVVSSMRHIADKEYAELRRLEALPANQTAVPRYTMVDTSSGLKRIQAGTTNIGFAVDITRAKAALQPVYEQLSKLMPQTQREASPGFQALKNILESDDLMPLSFADANRSALGSLSTGTGSVGLRTRGQGVATLGFKALDEAIDATVSSIDPSVRRALDRGREATRRKWEVADELKRLGVTGDGLYEPGTIFRRLVAPNDTSLARLRRVAQVAPDAMPELGRAWLEFELGKATAEGGFVRAAGLQKRWRDLGDKTKRILFPDRDVRANVDQFILAADRLLASKNPSGTAGSVAAATLAGGFLDPRIAMSQAVGTAGTLAMWNPTVVRSLVQDITKPIRAPVTVATGAGAGARAATLPAQMTPELAQERLRNQPPGQRLQYQDGSVWEVTATGTVVRIQ